MTLEGQKIVIVGGTSGMGMATARAAAAAGAHVTVASRSVERVERALAQLPDGSAGAVLDVTDDASITALLEQTGDLDHLVFTAGDAFTPKPLAAMTLEEAHAVLDVRFWGAVAVIRQAIPRINPGGSIALTTGTVGQRPVPGAALASAGAGAAEGLMRGLAAELKPLRVNVVRAGAFATEMWDRVPAAQREVLFSQLAERTLAGAVGDPEQIAAAHLFLMQNAYVTGTVLTVDGGLLLA